MIPLDWFIESDFWFDNSLINSDVRDKFLLARSSVESDEDHFEEPSLCERSIHWTYNTKFKCFLNCLIIIKLIMERSHYHQNSMHFYKCFIWQFSIPNSFLYQQFSVFRILHDFRSCILFVNNCNNWVKPLLFVKRGVKESLISPTFSPRVWVVVFLFINTSQSKQVSSIYVLVWCKGFTDTSLVPSDIPCSSITNMLLA